MGTNRECSKSAEGNRRIEHDAGWTAYGNTERRASGDKNTYTHPRGAQASAAKRWALKKNSNVARQTAISLSGYKHNIITSPCSANCAESATPSPALSAAPFPAFPP